MHVITKGYSLRGTRVECQSLLARGHRISSIAALHWEGILSVKTTTEAVNSDMLFYDFIRGEKILNMYQFDGNSSRSIATMDN